MKSSQSWGMGPHLFLLEVHAVPVMGQGRILPLPILQETDRPEGHEDAKEDRSWVVKQIPNLQDAIWEGEQGSAMGGHSQGWASTPPTFAMGQISAMYQVLQVSHRGHIRNSVPLSQTCCLRVIIRNVSYLFNFSVWPESYKTWRGPHTHAAVLLPSVRRPETKTPVPTTAAGSSQAV